MKQLFSLGAILLFIGCSNSISKEDLNLLNGYWEIEKVTFANGDSKEFKVSTTIDYIEIKTSKGFRKKMQPKFDGSYATSNDAEPFSIIEKESSYEFHYKNGLSEWTEKITSLSQNNFSVINKDTITYSYKRFQPITTTE